MVRLRVASQENTSPALLARLIQSCERGNIHVIRTSMQQPIGYFAWIRVCKESFRIVSARKMLPAMYFENDEGYLRIVYDVVFLPGMDLYCKGDLRNFISRSRLVGLHRGNSFKVLSAARSKSLGKL